MHWSLSWQADPHARALADRHYSRKTIGAMNIAPPGRKLVLTTPTAYWITSYPYVEYVMHAWAGAFLCSAFRNEGNVLSSTLIREAVAATVWRYPDIPDLGMVTFVDRAKVRPKRHPGYCFLKAGFEYVGKTKAGQIAMQLEPARFPDPEPPVNGAFHLWPAPPSPRGSSVT